MKKKVLLLCICITYFLALNTFAIAAGNEKKIIFLHHSTGAGVYNGGGVPGWFSTYNTQHGTSYQVSEATNPCMGTLTQNYNVIISNGACNSPVK